jgi:undecaprenyl-diphosphatase
VIPSIDESILLFFNQFAHRSWTVDQAIVLLSSSYLLGGGLVMAGLWWAWFRGGEAHTRTRQSILVTLLACIAAVVVARMLAALVPFRVRPLHNPALAFQLPFGMDPRRFVTWSAFPSDTAALFMALATGLLYVFGRRGIWGFGYIFLAICLPRIYLGVHYPTDTLVGALIGIGVVYILHRERIITWLTTPGLKWLHKHPSSFYACLFFVSQQDAFTDDALRIWLFLTTLLKEFLRRL